MSTTSATPLTGLDVVALDLETTSLDPRLARIVQIGAVRVHDPAADRAWHFATDVNPEMAIPAATTAIHGLSNGDVADAPTFRAVADGLLRFISGAVIAGHHIAYDLAVLEAEFERIGRPWAPPRALDTAILARFALPALPLYDLDSVASRLGIEIAGRHTAMGDAAAAAGIYEALLPLLREKGIRTLAEAEQASVRLAERQPATVRAPEPPAASQTEAVLQKLDSFPYRHRVRDVMSVPPATAPGDTTLQQAASRLVRDGISSVFVDGGERGIGIVTERDILRAIDRAGPAALAAPIVDIISAPLHTVSQDAFVYRAIGRMDRLGLRHLAVRDRDGALDRRQKRQLKVALGAVETAISLAREGRI